MERDSGIIAALRGDILTLSAGVLSVSSLSLRLVLAAFCGLRRTTINDLCFCGFAAFDRTGKGSFFFTGDVITFGTFDFAGLLVTRWVGSIAVFLPRSAAALRFEIAGVLWAARVVVLGSALI